jgi:pimeloyl-ACP methyl ester carboxylesterase
VVRRRPAEGRAAFELTLPDGRTLAYAEYGDPKGWPLVFLHGFPGSRLAAGVVDAAASEGGVRVLAPDRPGLGLSSPRSGRTLLDHAEDVRGLADALGIDRFAVLGESGGGPYALACAYALRERLHGTAVVCGLGPVGCAGATNAIALKERIGYAIAARAPLVAGRALVPFAAWARHSPRSFGHVTRWQLGEADREALRGPLGGLVAADFAEAFRQGGRGVGEDLALLFRPWPFDPAAIRVPVLFFHGTSDRTVSLAAARGVARTVPGARLEIFEQEGHFSLLARHADLVLRALQALRS